MSEIKRIQDQLKRSFFGPAWHGPSLCEALEGVSAELSAARQPGAHSIRELVDHSVFWKNVVNRVLRGIDIDLQTEVKRDWPEISDNSEDVWTAARKSLKSEHESFCATVAGYTEADLEREVMGVKNRYTAYQVMHGVIQHDLYHAGQIVLLKKPS
ncbi:MAG: DinB family protein [Candidatus Zixiibacteriota bacterium]